MRITIAVYSTNTFSSRFLAGFLSYCRSIPEIRPRIIRLRRGAEVGEHVDDLEGEALVLDQRFTTLLKDGWRPKSPGILQCFRIDEDLDYPQVGFHNEAIGRAAAKKLSEQGLRQLLFVNNRETVSSPLRWKGFSEAGREMGMAVSFFGDGTSQRGRDKIKFTLQMRDLVESLREIPGPVGVFANDDNRGERVLQAAEDAGLSVPQEVAVCCVSSTPEICEWTRPALSAFRLDHEGQGWLAAQWAHKGIAGKSPLSRLLAPWQYEERESSFHLRQSDPLIARALKAMKERVGEAPKIAEVARAAHTSKRTLERRFQSVLKQTPAEAMRELRMQATLKLLADADKPLKTVCVEAGWSDMSQMGRAVKRETGSTPARYRLQASRSRP